MSDQDPMLTLADAARRYAEAACDERRWRRRMNAEPENGAAWQAWGDADDELCRAVDQLHDAALRANGIDPDA